MSCVYAIRTYLKYEISLRTYTPLTKSNTYVQNLLQEIISGPDETVPEKMVKKQLMKQEVDKLLKTLNKREEHILRLRFGLNGEPPRSCEEIGRLLKLSRERVRQIYVIALSNLQQRSMKDNLVEFYVV